MALKIRGRIEVKSWHPKPEALGRALAADPGVRERLTGLAEQVSTAAQTNLYSLGILPPGKVDYPRHLGKFWSAQPYRVAQLVSVKDATKVFPLDAPNVSQAEVTRVALVVSDHPYSFPHEFGGYGIKSSGFMRKAVRDVAASNNGVKLRRYRRPEAAG
jgi:hypothetical protein